MPLYLSADEHAKVLDGCRFCGMCTHACTVGNATHNDANAPRGKGRLLYALHAGILGFTPRAVELLYQCCDCKLCQAWCVPSLDLGAAIRAARRDVAERGCAPASVLEVSQAILERGNPYGEPDTSLVQLDGAASKGQVLYFLDSHTGYREHAVAQATWRILQRLDIKPTLLPTFLDSGQVLLEFGLMEQARAQAERVLAAIRESNAQTVIFSAAGAYHMVAKEYSHMLGLAIPGLRLQHITEFVLEQISARQLELKPLHARVTYHDPCRLGRGMNVYDAPRQILARIPGLTLVEPHWTRDKAVCCGSGGGLPFTNPEIAADAAQQAGHVLRLTKPDIVVTGCARCKSSLAPTLRGIKVMEFSELLEQVL
jgi:Fe-S oxidoreductase